MSDPFYVKVYDGPEKFVIEPTDWSHHSIELERQLKKMDDAATLGNWAEAGRHADKAAEAASELCLIFAAKVGQK